jgi:hypothetical protein
LLGDGAIVALNTLTKGFPSAAVGTDKELLAATLAASQFHELAGRAGKALINDLVAVIVNTIADIFRRLGASAHKHDLFLTGFVVDTRGRRRRGALCPVSLGTGLRTVVTHSFARLLLLLLGNCIRAVVKIVIAALQRGGFVAAR